MLTEADKPWLILFVGRVIRPCSGGILLLFDQKLGRDDRRYVR